MTGRLAHKRALVTAAGAGIGRAIAIAFAREGAQVIATNRSGSKLDGLADEGVAAMHELDVTDMTATRALSEQIGTLDVLINCAGVVQPNTVLSCSDDDLNTAIEINLIGTIRTIQAFMPQMIANGGGTIVNIGSIISSLKGAPDRFAYGTTKGAINGLTKSISVDFAAQGIRINTICPGTIETESMNARISGAQDPDAARAMFSARHPVGRLGKPQEIAALAIHLAGDESGFTTGQTIVVDGGWTA
ncbi:MAG: SDR family oxidoreductase [Rhizobiales bacterium]|nr:SDR family oxidoreductase [Hyphomicrobiales bacterium]